MLFPGPAGLLRNTPHMQAFAMHHHLSGSFSLCILSHTVFHLSAPVLVQAMRAISALINVTLLCRVVLLIISRGEFVRELKAVLFVWAYRSSAAPFGLKEAF